MHSPYPQARPQSLGASRKTQSHGIQGFQPIFKRFLLDRNTSRMQPPQKGAAPGNQGDSQRPVFTALRAFFPEFNHRLIHRLTPHFQRLIFINKAVDKSPERPRKRQRSKNNHTATALMNKGLQPTTPTLPTATSTANGDKSKR